MEKSKVIRSLIYKFTERFAAKLIGFVIQMDGVTEVRANRATHPEFADAMEEARKAGVKAVFFTCHVEPDELTVTKAIEA